MQLIQNSTPIDVDFSKFIQGRGFWKFNNSLLKDINFVEKVKDGIKETVCKYARIDGDNNFFLNANSEEISDFFDSQTPESLQNLELSINPELFLDVLLLEVRQITIKYSVIKKKERVATEQLLLHEIETLESGLNKSSGDDFNIISERLQLKKNDLEAVYDHKAQGAFIRVRAKYRIEGEKPTRLFCSLEKHNAMQKYIPQLKINKDGVEEV